MTVTPVGLDFGNTQIKISLLDKNDKLRSISIPAMYAFDQPVIVGASGKELKAKAFSLLFRRDDDTDVKLWYGQDILASNSVIHKLDEAKYDPGHTSILFRAALYAWSERWNTPLSDLGKLSIVVSMPPGLYQQAKLRTQAENAYDKAFNRGQSHVKIRSKPGKAIQIVTQFQKLVREAVLFGSDIPHKGELVLVVDIGGGTRDTALFNGSAIPLKTWSKNSGLIHAFEIMNPTNPKEAELKAIKNKNNPNQAIISFFNDVENDIRRGIRALPQSVKRIYIIGGGASLMPVSVKANIKAIADKVIIKDEFANSEANWKEASHEKG